MEIKKCQFDQPVEKRYSTGLYRGMFNEDVTFQFEVDVKVTDRNGLESMLKLFERVTTDFKAVLAEEARRTAIVVRPGITS